MDIATNNYQKNDRDEYETIPENAVKLSDLLIRNIHFKNDTIEYATDIAIRQDETTTIEGFFHTGRVVDVGDLKETHGYRELDDKGLSFVEVKLYERSLHFLSSITAEKSTNLLNQENYYLNV